MIVLRAAGTFSALRPELPPADAVKMQVEDRLAGIVAGVAGEPIAGRLHAHLAGDPSRHRDQPTERRLVPRLALSGRGKMLLRDDEEVDRRDPDRVILRKIKAQHEVIVVQHLRPNLTVDDLAEHALGQMTVHYSASTRRVSS